MYYLNLGGGNVSEVSNTILKCLVNADINMNTNIAKKTLCLTVNFDANNKLASVDKKENVYYDCGDKCIIPMLGKSVGYDSSDLLYVHVNNRENKAEFYVKDIGWELVLKIVLGYLKMQHGNKSTEYGDSKLDTIKQQVNFLAVLYNNLKSELEGLRNA